MTQTVSRLDASGRSCERLCNEYESFRVQIIASLHHYFPPSWIPLELSELTELVCDTADAISHFAVDLHISPNSIHHSFANIFSAC